MTMTVTAEARPMVLSSLVDLSTMSLAELIAAESVVDEAVDRVIPDTPVSPVTVAAFNSAI
jgi:FXSXX-COOH protein